MSAEADLRAALLAWPALVIKVPAARVSIDMLPADAVRPYIVFSKQSGTRDMGLGGALLASTDTIDVLCVGINRADSIAVAELVRAALDAIGQPSERSSAAYDADNDLEVEIVSTDWIAV